MTTTFFAFDAELRTAIAEKRLLRLRYQGRLRTVEPHDYGLQGGTARLFVYQLRASPPSASSRPAGWRLLTVSEIEGVVVLDEHFAGSRGTSRQRHRDWDVVFARVS